MNNKNLCPDCGKPMEMYYTLQCFHCKKPTPNEKDRGNLLMARNWLINNEPEFKADDWWKEICDNYEFHNDSWIELFTIEESNDRMPQSKIFNKHFPVEGILWEVSW